MAGNFMTIISVSMHHVVHIRADVILRRGDVSLQDQCLSETWRMLRWPRYDCFMKCFCPRLHPAQ